MEIAYQRHINAHPVQLLTHKRHSLRSLGRIHGHAHHLGAGQREFFHLNRCADDINRVGIGHGLHPDRGIPAHRDHTGVPDDARLPRLPGPGIGRFNWYRAVHYFTSKRATLSLVDAVKSKFTPRI